MGFGFDFFQFVGVALHLLSVFFLDGFHLLGVLERKNGKLIEEKLVIAAANFLGLVVGPLIGGARLQQNFLGVGAMPEQGDGGDEHGENGHGQGDGSEAGFVRGFFRVFFQFADFVGHFSSQELESRWIAAGAARELSRKRIAEGVGANLLLDFFVRLGWRGRDTARERGSCSIAGSVIFGGRKL